MARTALQVDGDHRERLGDPVVAPPAPACTSVVREDRRAPRLADRVVALGPEPPSVGGAEGDQRHRRGREEADAESSGPLQPRRARRGDLRDRPRRGRVGASDDRAERRVGGVAEPHGVLVDVGEGDVPAGAGARHLLSDRVGVTVPREHDERAPAAGLGSEQVGGLLLVGDRGGAGVLHAARVQAVARESRLGADDVAVVLGPDRVAAVVGDARFLVGLALELVRRPRHRVGRPQGVRGGRRPGPRSSCSGRTRR